MFRVVNTIFGCSNSKSGRIQILLKEVFMWFFPKTVFDPQSLTDEQKCSLKILEIYFPPGWSHRSVCAITLGPSILELVKI